MALRGDALRRAQAILKSKELQESGGGEDERASERRGGDDVGGKGKKLRKRAATGEEFDSFAEGIGSVSVEGEEQEGEEGKSGKRGVKLKLRLKILDARLPYERLTNNKVGY